MDTTIVKTMGKLSEEAYSSYREPDIVKDLPYKVLAVSDMPSGFQGMLVEELNAQGVGTKNYV